MKRLRYMKYNKPSPTFCCFIGPRGIVRGRQMPLPNQRT